MQNYLFKLELYYIEINLLFRIKWPNIESFKYNGFVC